MDVDMPILARPQSNPHGSIDSHGQNKTVVVVGVLADQVDAARRAYDQARRLAEAFSEGLSHLFVYGHLSSHIHSDAPRASARRWR